MKMGVTFSVRAAFEGYQTITFPVPIKIVLFYLFLLMENILIEN